MKIPYLPERDWLIVRVRDDTGHRFSGREGVAVGRDERTKMVRVMFQTSERWKDAVKRIMPESELQFVRPWTKRHETARTKLTLPRRF